VRQILLTSFRQTQIDKVEKIQYSVDPSKRGRMKNTMKQLCFLLLILLLAAGTVFAQDEKYEGMSGSETPAFQKFSDKGNCFVFGKYVVKTDKTDEGENVGVYKREGSIDGEGACQTKGEAYLFIKDADNNSFFGIIGNHLFIDSGTSVESRGLEIYDLASGKSVFTDSYTGDPNVVEGEFVVFDSPSDKKGLLSTCKEAAKWKRDGGGVGWVQGRRLNLQTLKVTNVGTLRCYYLQ
jgi:hypothetical protein